MAFRDTADMSAISLYIGIEKKDTAAPALAEEERCDGLGAHSSCTVTSTDPPTVKYEPHVTLLMALRSIASSVTNPPAVSRANHR